MKRLFLSTMLLEYAATVWDPATKTRDGVMVMCNDNALQCITIFKVMGSNV